MMMEQTLAHIEVYHYNDVLCGRGRYIRDHAGNKYFISLIKELKSEYVVADRKEKPLYAHLVVEHIRSLDPPGRFLKRCHKTHKWFDIGDREAIAKARQALREGAPEVLKQLQAGNISGKGVFAKMKEASMTSNVLPLVCEESQSETSNDEAMKCPETEHDQRETLSLGESSTPLPHENGMLFSSNEFTSADIQPIPFQGTMATTVTSRDDANTLLRILSSESCLDELPNVQQTRTMPLHRTEQESEKYTDTEASHWIGCATIEPTRRSAIVPMNGQIEKPSILMASAANTSDTNAAAGSMPRHFIVQNVDRPRRVRDRRKIGDKHGDAGKSDDKR